MSLPARSRPEEERTPSRRVAEALPGLLLAYVLAAVLLPAGVPGLGLVASLYLAGSYCAVLLLLLRERPRPLVVLLALAITLAGGVADALLFLYPVAAGLLACRLFGEGRGEPVARYRALQLAVAIAPLGLLAFARDALLPLLCAGMAILVAVQALAQRRPGWALVTVLSFLVAWLCARLFADAPAPQAGVAGGPASFAPEPWWPYGAAVLLLLALAAWLEPRRARPLVLLVCGAAFLLAAGAAQQQQQAALAASFLLLAGALLAARSRPRAGALLLAPAVLGAWLLAQPRHELTAVTLGDRLALVAAAPWGGRGARTAEPLDREDLRRIELAGLAPGRAATALPLPLPQAAASARR